MIEPGGLTGSGVGGHGGPAIAAGQQEHGSGGKGSDGDAAPTEPELYLCYAMEGGLFNQYYSHVSALAAAVAIGAKGLVSCHVQWHFTALCRLPCTCACCRDQLARFQRVVVAVLEGRSNSVSGLCPPDSACGVCVHSRSCHRCGGAWSGRTTRTPRGRQHLWTACGTWRPFRPMQQVIVQAA